jgi:hypothetical protein
MAMFGGAIVRTRATAVNVEILKAGAKLPQEMKSCGKSVDRCYVTRERKVRRAKENFR